MSIYLCLSVCLSVCLPVCLPACACLSMCLSVCVSLSWWDGARVHLYGGKARGKGRGLGFGRLLKIDEGARSRPSRDQPAGRLQRAWY